MLTYRARLRGDRLEWLGEAPQFRTDAPLDVQVTLIEPEPVAEEPSSNGPAMVALLERLAERGAFSMITDAGQWQRELRQERSLPGREE